MDEQDHALHEIADARARMSELADELARHARPEHVKELAAEKASEWKERAKEMASEKAAELKTHAKEAVMQKTMDVKERVDTPRGWSLLGAIVGAGVGAALMKKAFSVREERPIGDLKDHWFGRALESQPLMLAVGSIALGVFTSLLLPVSNRERRLIEPAKSKVQESISQLGDQLGQKLQGQEAGDRGSATGTMGNMGNIGSSEGLMGAERPGIVGSDRSDMLASPTGSRIPPQPPLDDVSTKIH